MVAPFETEPAPAPPPPAVPPSPEASAIEHDPSDAAKVTEWLARIDAAEAHWKDAFKQMKVNQDFAAKGADKKWIKDGCYRVPILNRHINQSVSKLYARNPTATATRRRQLHYKLWDGRQDSLQAALDSAMTMADPNAVALLEEVQAVLKFDLMMDRMGETMEIAWDYYLNEQSTNYKKQLKAMVRRTKVCGVSYVKLVFQRALKMLPEIHAKIEDTTAKLAEMQRLMAKQAEGDLEATSAEASTLRTLLADLQQQEYVIVREGPVLDFPKSDQVLIDPEVTDLSSLAGAGWIAFPYDKTPEEIAKLYKIKLGDDFNDFVADTSGGRKAPISAKEGRVPNKARKVRVYEVWDKETQEKFVIVRGYGGFAEVPAAPKPQLSRFWPLFPLVFNAVEHDEMVIPPSDIEQAKDIQNEYNRSREGLRQHRIAARPYYVENGRLTETDRGKLAQHLDHEVLSLQGMAPGDDIAKVIQRGPTVPIDPNLYEVEIHFKDLLRVVGSQESNFGGTSDGTATASSIAENSSSTQTSDNVDDLDEMLTELSIAAGEMMLMECSKETIVEIVGEGAVWPDHPQSRVDAAKHLSLKIEAGSSGRPNEAAELAKLERATPFLVQVPGINPTPLAKRYSKLLELPLDEFIAEGMPSITAINAAMSKQPAAAPGTGDPATDPNAQGPAGGQNAPVAAGRPPGPQPGFPAPAPI